MLRIKKGFSEQLLQMTLLLSLIGCDRLWPCTFGIWSSAPPPEVEVGLFDHWGDESNSYGFGPLARIHPKSVDRYLDRQWLLNELLSLGRFGDRYPSNIDAYLLNVDGDENKDQQQEAAGGQAVKTEPKENGSGDEDEDKAFDTDIVEDVFMLAPEDAQLVEALWKVDLDCGSTATAGEGRCVSPYGGINNDEGSFLLPGDEPPSRNHTFTSPPSSSDRRWFLPPLNFNSTSDLAAGFSSFPSRFERARNSDGNSWEVSHLLVDLGPAGESHSRRASNENDTDTLGLDAEQSADYKNNRSTGDDDDDAASPPSLTSDFRVKESPWYEPSFEFDLDDFEHFTDMMQCYSQPPPSSRHFQGRMGYTRHAGGNGMDQRGWQDLAACTPMLAFPGEGQHHQHHYAQHTSSGLNYPPAPSMYHHHHHHHHHNNNNNNNNDNNDNTGNVLLQNVSLCAPPPPTTSIAMGGSHAASSSSSSSSLSHYHHHSSTIGVSTNCNLSSAVATSLHLPGSSSEQPAAFKTEPNQHEMMFPYQNHNSEMAPSSSDGLLSSILNDDDLQLMDPAAMGADVGMYPVRMMDSASSSVACNNAMVQNTTNAGGGDSDSAVSSMGSERVPSLSSDTEWMETNSDSGHNDGGYPTQSNQEYGKMRWLDNYLYSGSRGHSAAPQKKYQLYGRRISDPVPEAPNVTETGRPNNHHMGLVPDSLNLPYDMSVREGVPVPGSSQFTRHMAGCSRVMTPEQQVSLNHTYALPAEGLRIPRNKLKSSKRSEDEQLTRDEKRARNLNIPISVDDIINLPMDEFNERLSKYDLSESQLTLIRDIRRRGKNKVAAQNCRKRKLDQILSLADEVKQMKDRKFNLLQEREYLMTERMRVKTKYDLLYNHIFASLRDPDGNPYSPYTHTLREQPDGSVSIVPRNNGAQTERNPRSKQHKDK